MYAVVRRYQGVTTPEEVARRVNETAIPMATASPGFVAYYALDAGEGVMASVSVFDDRGSADAFSERALAWLRDNLTAFVPNPPEVTAGEVVAEIAAGAFAQP
jgi:hypothetical protein